MGNWEQHFKKPKNLKMYVIHTGYVHMSGNIHFNNKSPKFKAMPIDERFNPVFAFLVAHPDEGYVLLDTGLHSSFVESRFGNVGRLLGTIVKTKTEKGKDVISQLYSINVSPSDIRCIVLSHLHLDHPSGLPLFRNINDLKVFVDEDELKAAQSPFGFLEGYVKAHFKHIDMVPIRYQHRIPPFDKVCDFFGDKSLFLIGTPGHSPGHVSALLNMVGGPIFLTFDATHRRSNILEGVPPKGNYEVAVKSLQNITTFLQKYPNIQPIFSHDPDQLSILKLLPKYYS